MFIAKFSPTTGAPFNADKNGNMPMIGDVQAGTATGTLMNGTMFQREGLQPNKLYACENEIDPEYPTNVRVKVVAEVSVIEYLALKAQLGAPKVTIGATAPATIAEEEIA